MQVSLKWSPGCTYIIALHLFGHQWIPALGPLRLQRVLEARWREQGVTFSKGTHTDARGGMHFIRLEGAMTVGLTIFISAFLPPCFFIHLDHVKTALQDTWSLKWQPSVENLDCSLGYKVRWMFWVNIMRPWLKTAHFGWAQAVFVFSFTRGVCVCLHASVSQIFKVVSDCSHISAFSYMECKWAIVKPYF